MKRVFFILMLSIFCTMHLTAQSANDSLSLNDYANLEVSRYLNSLPPVIKIGFFADGKKVTKPFSGYVVFKCAGKETILAFSPGAGVLIDTNRFTIHDSLFIRMRYKKYQFQSNTVPCSFFWHGGRSVFGLITDYLKEKQKFQEDDTRFLDPKIKNDLYLVMTVLTKSGVTAKGKGRKMIYCCLHSNLYEVINLRYFLIKAIGTG